jgi:predicted nucleic acid-binding protein
VPWDSSVAIAAERRGDTVQAFLQRVIETAGDQEAALSRVGVVELVHGIHRADTAERRARGEAFVEELLSTVTIHPLTTDSARLAGKLDAEQQSRGIVVPFADLLIGATALSLGYSMLTVKCAPLRTHSRSACHSALRCRRTLRALPSKISGNHWMLTLTHTARPIFRRRGSNDQDCGDLGPIGVLAVHRERRIVR